MHQQKIAFSFLFFFLDLILCDFVVQQVALVTNEICSPQSVLEKHNTFSSAPNNNNNKFLFILVLNDFRFFLSAISPCYGPLYWCL